MAAETLPWIVPWIRPSTAVGMVRETLRETLRETPPWMMPWLVWQTSEGSECHLGDGSVVEEKHRERLDVLKHGREGVVGRSCGW
jgi:hypothetical protein